MWKSLDGKRTISSKINHKNKGKPTGERDGDITTFKCMGLVCILILSMKENANLWEKTL